MSRAFNGFGFQDPFRIGYNDLDDVIDDNSDLQINPLSDNGSIVFADHSNSYDESVPGPTIPSQSSDENQIIRMGKRSADNLLFLSLLEHMCILFVGEGDVSKRLFQLLYEKLWTKNLITNVGPLDKVKAIMQTYQKELGNVMMAALSTLKIYPLKPDQVVQKLQVDAGTRGTQSWYKEMFFDESKIASGGFGEVVKVKNKLDQKYYAIKKVKLVESQPGLCYKTLREVQVFSDLIHANIVRYHCSWLEYGASEFDTTDPDNCGITSQSFSSTEASSYGHIDYKEYGKFNVNLVKNSSSQNALTYGNFCPKSNAEANDGNNPSVDEKRRNSFTRSYSSGDVPLSPEQMDEISFVRGKFYDSNFRKAHNMTLFIQMELCHVTLRNWMKERNEVGNLDTDVNKGIFRQLLSGLDYIHREGLIHRDIKPANVFLYLNDEITVKIGDFGLARNNNSPQTPTGSITGNELDTCSNRRTYVGYTQGVGTTVYAAPEQKVTTDYTNKVDIFSAGIILFELNQIFRTEMEKMSLLSDLLHLRTCGKEVHVCTDLCSLILNMTSNKAEERPSASTLLEHQVLMKTTMQHETDGRVNELERKCSEQELEITRLRSMIEVMESKMCPDCFLCIHQCHTHQ